MAIRNTCPVIEALLEYERYIPVMSYAETAQLRAGRLDWGREDFTRWEMLLALREQERRGRIAQAMERSKRGGKCKSGADVEKYLTADVTESR